MFSRDPEKKEDAYKLGAKEFCVVPSSSEHELDLEEGVNLLLLCGGSLPDFELYVLPVVGLSSARCL